MGEMAGAAVSTSKSLVPSRMTSTSPTSDGSSVAAAGST